MTQNSNIVFDYSYQFFLIYTISHYQFLSIIFIWVGLGELMKSMRACYTLTINPTILYLR